VGASWEGMVIETILRGLNATGTDHDAFHFRTGGGAEVDLVLDGVFGLVPIEIKHTQTVEPRALKALAGFVSEWNCKMGIVITNDERPRLLSETIAAIPFGCL
jgi:predicted AAA+ superfamily ATPase